MTRLFTGAAAAVTTPFIQGNVDYDSFKNHLIYLKKNRIQAFVINGTTGESSTLTKKEKATLLSIAIDVADGDIPVIAGTGSNNTADAIAHSQEAEKLGVDALLVITPYYNKTSQKGLLAHFTAIAEAVTIPIILYDVPARTGMTIAPETLEVLALKQPNIVGLKDATGDLAHLNRLQYVVDDSFSFYSGNDDLALPFYALGGHGLISVLANALPKEYQEMYEAAQKYPKKAAEISHRLFPLVDALGVDVNPIPIKVLTSHLGFGDYSLRLPLVPLESAAQDVLTELFDHTRKDD
ncbi:4-hydroxy-tetrahydrodipicolinate synthase [Alkalibacterium subtropicum]|uniref:4-hydroxy-tetrahydrodipicolinate synthase n=1 Tax=Alkalibacterium subtropicum TaxID=753702 RepID=A0A1I1JE18_9LACT|nr:4-hydroxy-tetrahydrodipicolinate synthase [Alkalibacterium subtropicum]SFC46222.1 4-hydroxy-tetrahydrodipicolinate synthase [Alkalibacterium subtropicum]